MRHAVYSGTRNLYHDMLTAAKSLIANSSVTDVWLLVEDDEFPHELPPIVNWHVMNMSEQEYIRPDGPNRKSVFTYMAMIRAAFPLIFPQLDRIVSFDCDTVCVDDVDYLWEVNLGGNWFGANWEYNGTYRPYGSDYWNVGVCIYDLKAIREAGAGSLLVDKVNNERMWCVEQDAIVSTGKVFTLPERYNESAVTSYTDNPAVVHFASFGTDWHGNNKAPRKEYYRKYEAMGWDEVAERHHG